MARKPNKVIDFFGGISIAKKVGQPGSFRFGTHLNIQDDPNELTLMPAAAKVSGSTVVGLVKWIEDGTPHDGNRYFYDDTGRIYKEDSSGAWSVLQATTNSRGQGLTIHADYLYYTQNEQIGRYGPLSGTPAFDDDWQTGLENTGGTGLAPIMAFKEGFAVGHGNKVAWYDGAVWEPEALTLPAELNVRTFTKTDRYIVIGAWRGTSVTDSEDGYIFVWDTLSDTFDDFYPTDGGINAMNYNRNRLLSIHGHQGYLYMDSAPFNKVHQIPRVGLRESVEVLPGAMTTWKGQNYFGISDSTSTASFRGVYSYGAKSQLFDDAMTYAFSISTGNNGSTVKIGALKGIGSELYIGWQDATTFGVDKVSNNSLYATTGTYESLIEDDQRPKDEKLGVKIEIAHLPLATGESVAVNYKIDRAADWTAGSTNAEVGSRATTCEVPYRFFEFEWQAVLTGPGTTTPMILEQELIYDDVKEERRE